jgi:peptidoglycan/LPS O-acetylase OafA/YrhL
LGVDIFFVLSGFLIADILIREIRKYGHVEFFHFLRSRFLRIWPALFLQAIVGLGFGQGLKAGIVSILFIFNFFEIGSHLWSVSVEFQFYLFSPLIVTQMYFSERPHMIPLILFAMSMILNLYLFRKYNPTFLSSGHFDDEMTPDFSNFLYWIYMQMPTRVSPYLFGMYSALKFNTDTTFDSVFLDWLSILAIFATLTIGGEPYFLNEYIGYKTNLAIAMLVRPILGMALSFQIYLMLAKE